MTILKRLHLQLTTNTMRVLDSFEDEKRNPLIERLLWLSPRFRQRARQLGIERETRPKQGNPNFGKDTQT